MSNVSEVEVLERLFHLKCDRVPVKDKNGEYAGFRASYHRKWNDQRIWRNAQEKIPKLKFSTVQRYRNSFYGAVVTQEESIIIASVEEIAEQFLGKKSFVSKTKQNIDAFLKKELQSRDASRRKFAKQLMEIAKNPKSHSKFMSLFKLDVKDGEGKHPSDMDDEEYMRRVPPYVATWNLKGSKQ